jgi:hypothetical protein
MQEKLILVLMIAGAALLLLLGGNVLEKQKVITALDTIISPSNKHTLKDRTGLEDEIFRRVESVVGEEANVEVELYHYRGRVEKAAWEGAVPRYGGVTEEGSSLALSALICRVWWTQTILGKRPQDVHVVKTMFVEPDFLGSSYSPPSNDFAEVKDPTLLLKASE